MSKIIGNTTVTPVMPADWEQTDETKVDYIKNKPGIEKGEGQQSLKQKTVSAMPINMSNGTGAVALGVANRTHADYAMTVNFNNKAYAPHSFVANSGNIAEAAAEGAFVAGHGNTAINKFQTVLGVYADVGTDDVFVVGTGDDKNTRSSIRVNKYHGDVTIPILCVDHLTLQYGLSVPGHLDSKSLDVAQEAQIANAVFSKKAADFNPNVVTADGAMAFGGSNEIYGRNCVALLTSNTIPEGCESVFIAGHGNKAVAPHQYIMGTYADPNPDGKDLFIVGNGQKEGEERNALVVRRNGQVMFYNSIFLGSTELTAASLKALLAGEKEVYLLKEKVEELEAKIAALEAK